ncbi:MAG: hypothetical protein KTR18_02910 [Acidiferrobacterales bacterium]|nr:hypothetical protein [Acidiferrobacterales bacterium]
MEMSPEYALETVKVMANRGYTLEVQEKERVDGDIVRFKGVYYHLGADQQKLVLEVLHYPSQEVRFFFEIVEFYGLSSFSFELDSWKHRDEYVEFRYYTNPETGGALTFKLKFPDSAKDEGA